MRPCVSCGKRRLSQRSRRWSPSPCATVTVCTPVMTRGSATGRGPRRARRWTGDVRRSRRAAASPSAPRSYSVTASSEKAEKVVKPPRMPVITKGDVRQPALSGETDEQPHGKGAQDVDRQHAERKGGMPEQPHETDAGEIPQRGADGAAEGDLEDGGDHGRVMGARGTVNGQGENCGRPFVMKTARPSAARFFLSPRTSPAAFSDRARSRARPARRNAPRLMRSGK
jgi:hypothetical protein